MFGRLIFSGNRFKTIAKLAFVGTVVSAQNHSFYLSKTHSDNTNRSDNAKASTSTAPIAVDAAKTPVMSIDDEEDEDDETWEKNKAGCSFCAQFIASPCKVPFRTWSKCVEKAKRHEGEGVNFVEYCKAQTKALMECVGENEAYFKKANEEEGGMWCAAIVSFCVVCNDKMRTLRLELNIRITA